MAVDRGTSQKETLWPRPSYVGEIWKRNNHRPFWICLRLGKSSDYRDVIVVEKLRFQDVFRPHWNVKAAFPNSPGLKSVFDKLHFGDGLVWAVDLTLEIKLRFQISPAHCGRGVCPQFSDWIGIRNCWVFCKSRCIWIFAVPSENKRDVRSIEETLNDIRKRKKFRPDDLDDENEED